MIKKLFMISICFLLTSCALKGFTHEEQISFTTLRTLEAAKIFRVTTLKTCGELYKQGKISENDKIKIIEIGNNLQHAINILADILITFEATKDKKYIEQIIENMDVYQKIFNDFMEFTSQFLGEI